MNDFFYLKKPKFFNDFRLNRSLLIFLNSVNITSEIWDDLLSYVTSNNFN